MLLEKAHNLVNTANLAILKFYCIIVGWLFNNNIKEIAVYDYTDSQV